MSWKHLSWILMGCLCLLHGCGKNQDDSQTQELVFSLCRFKSPSSTGSCLKADNCMRCIAKGSGLVSTSASCVSKNITQQEWQKKQCDCSLYSYTECPPMFCGRCPSSGKCEDLSTLPALPPETQEPMPPIPQGM